MQVRSDGPLSRSRDMGQGQGRDGGTGGAAVSAPKVAAVAPSCGPKLSHQQLMMLGLVAERCLIRGPNRRRTLHSLIRAGLVVNSVSPRLTEAGIRAISKAQP